MKQIYFLLATMAVLLMAGCSNEEIIPDTPEEGAIVFSTGISNGVKTKADVLVLDGEDVIRNLTVLLFDGTDGTYKYGKRIENAGGVTFVGDLEVAPGTYDIILIANSGINYTSDANKPATLNVLNDKVDDVKTQTQSNLLMVSKLFENVTLAYKELAGGGGYERRTYCYMFQAGDVASYNTTQHTSQTELDEVYTGANAPVVMTRLASRIQLESVAFDGTANLEGATFKLTDVYLVNARPTTLLIPDETSYEAGEGYYRGAPAEFIRLDGMIHPEAAVETYYAKTYADVTITDGGAAKSFTSGTNMFQTYAFENHTEWVYDLEKTEYDARLVIAGVITLKDGQVQPASYYHVQIKGDDFQLTRNNVYGINVSITSYGYNNPDGRIGGGGGDEPGDDNAKIDVKIEVNPWKVIDQYEEDEF